MPLETEARAQVRALVADLKPNDADLLQALHRIQHEFGYLSREAMEVVGEQLGLYAAEVYGAATFYSEFRFEPPPAVTIRWCSGPACHLRNGRGIRDAMLATLGLQELGEQTADGRVGMWLGQCNGTCELAPQVWLEEHGNWDDARVVGQLTAAKAVRLARALRDGTNPDEVLRD